MIRSVIRFTNPIRSGMQFTIEFLIIWSDAIRSVDTYQDPINGVEVEVPNIYEKAWTDGNNYVFTNDPFFDPNQNAGPNWTPLERRP